MLYIRLTKSRHETDKATITVTTTSPVLFIIVAGFVIETSAKVSLEVSFTSEGRKEWEIDRQIGAVYAVVDEPDHCGSDGKNEITK